MFVLWYCHKRGKEVRLDKATDPEKADGEAQENGDSVETEDTDDDIEEDVDPKEVELEDTVMKEMEAKLGQPDPSQIPLPDT